MCIFLIFSVAIIPQIAIFKYGSNQNTIDKEIDSKLGPLPMFSVKNIVNWLDNYFYETTIGNLGKSDFPCEGINLQDLAFNFFLGGKM
jgi:hypothetical protein